MELLIEKTVCTNNRCYACGSLVYDVEKKKTANHIYHTRCFCCRICKRNLTASSLNEEGDDIYCENCYRKKQRGDCQSVGFQRAASERGQYVYNNRHPDQPSPRTTLRRPILRDLAQSPSWALRQLELRFRARENSQPATLQRATTIEVPSLGALSLPLPRKRTYPSPVTFTKFSRRSSTGKSSMSTSLPDVSPLPSPSPRRPVLVTSFPEKKPTARRVKFADVVYDAMTSRLNRQFTNLTDAVDTLVERRRSMGDDVKENETTPPRRTRFRSTVSTIMGRDNSNTNNPFIRRKLN